MRPECRICREAPGWTMTFATRVLLACWPLISAAAPTIPAAPHKGQLSPASLAVGSAEVDRLGGELKVLCDAGDRNQGKAESQPKADAVDEAIMHEKVGRAQNLLASGQAEEATSALCEVVRFRSELYGTQDPRTLAVINDLGVILRKDGRNAEARRLLQDVLALIESQRIADPLMVCAVQQNLATALYGQGAYEEAERIYRSALASAHSAHLPPEQIGPILTNIGFTLDQEGRLADGEQILREVLKVRQNSPRKNDEEIAASLTNLGANLTAQGKATAGEAYLRQGLRIREQLFGAKHLNVAFSQVRLANNLLIQGRSLPEADQLATVALETRRKELGDSHQDTIATFDLLARIKLKAGDAAAALTDARIGLKGGTAIWARETGPLSDGTEDAAFADPVRAATVFSEAAWQLSGAKEHQWSGTTTPALAREVFEAVQGGSWSSTAMALARSTARAAARDAGQYQIAIALEERLKRLSELDKQLAMTAARAQTDARNGALLASQRAEQVKVQADVARLTGDLRQRFPAFFQFVVPEPLSLASLQDAKGSLLGHDEVLLLISPGEDEYRGFIWAVTDTEVAWAQLDVAPEALEKNIVRLRVMLDPLGTRAPDSGVPEALARGARGFDRQAAFSLYKSIFAGPAIKRLAEPKKRWIIVPQGSLVALPFVTLVISTPQSGTAGDVEPTALRATRWLGLEHALSLLPSATGLKVLRGARATAASTVSRRWFFGLGDPDYGGALHAYVGPAQRYYRDGIPDVAKIRQLPRLPGTRKEITDLAAVFSENSEDYLLGPAATKYALWHRPVGRELSSYRILTFATHGLVAGDLGGSLGEPALALTPPPKPTNEDDGLLTASEAASLQLDADWVILSACNTAAGGRPHAEGLTGLTRAFLLAGARALLVSHWRVRDDAAGRLTTRAIQLMAARPALSRTDAMQASMRELMMDGSLDTTAQSFAQPSAWAPFTLIGVD